MPMLIELFIASRVNKAADSLRRIAEEDDYHSGIDAFERLLAYGRRKRMDKIRIQEQLGEMPTTPRQVDIPSDDDPYNSSQLWI
jgi:hypothetical protein